MRDYLALHTYIYACFEVDAYEDWSNVGSVTLGIMLILVSMVFQYGAELEEKE